jgi:hypothetical protein
MSPNVRKLLDQIDAELVQGSADSQDLWAILSALRGPDDDEEGTAKRATVRIRREAFPLTASRVQPYYPRPIRRATFDVTYAAKPGESIEGPDHFQDHIHEAYRVLGFSNGQ